jgi:hypothetical protein
MIQLKTRANSLIVQCSKSKSVAVDRRMYNPKCPSCGQGMWLTRTVTAPHLLMTSTYSSASIASLLT